MPRRNGRGIRESYGRRGVFGRGKEAGGRRIEDGFCPGRGGWQVGPGVVPCCGRRNWVSGRCGQPVSDSVTDGPEGAVPCDGRTRRAYR
jgi:hypothetical protein